MYAPITDFRGGLDTRKMSLALPAGTLIECDNAHINQGAEIEKRKAFVQNTIPYSSTFPTFGACGTPSGIFIFGSGSLAAGAVPNSVTPGTFPSPMVYQMLVHPAVTALTSYAQGTHNMTAAVYSTLFGQFPFVIAKFADGGVYCFYNGVQVVDYAAGVVLAYLSGSASGLSSAIANLVNRTNNYTAATNGASLDIFSTPGSSYSAGVIIESLSCITVATNVSTTYPTGTVSNDTGFNSPDGSKVTIGGQVYRFKSAMAAAFDVQIGATSLATMQNLYLAIGATGTIGTNYYTGTTANANVKASLFIQTPNPSFTLTATALNPVGETYNLIAGISLTQEAATVPQATGAQAQGQFQIVAGVASAAAVGTITTDGTQPSTGATVVIWSKTYRFESTMAQAYDVKIAASAALTLANLVLAVNGTGTAGTNYYTGTLANRDVTASISGNVATLTAITPGTAGNTLTLTGATHLAAVAFAGGKTSSLSGVTVGPLYAYATITSTGVNLSNGDTLAIGATTYTFKSTLSTEGDVQIGNLASDTIQNLIAAINQTGVYSLNYQVSSLSFQFQALATTQGGKLVIIARNPGAAGNSIALTSSTANLVAPATMAGGADTLALMPSAVQWMPSQTLQQFGNSVAASISSQQASTGFYAVNKNGTICLYSLGFNSYSAAAVVTTTVVGQIAISQGGFSYTHSGAQAGSINTVVVANQSLLPTSQSLGTGTLAQLVTTVANAINANSATSTIANPAGGFYAINAYFTAVPAGNILYLSRLVTSSSDFPMVESTMPDNTYIIGSEVAALGLSATIPATLAVPNTGTASATCLATGGYPPYAYNWVIAANADPTLNLVLLNNGTNTANFSIDPTSPNPHAIVTCTVTDSKSNSVTSNTMNVGKT